MALPSVHLLALLAGAALFTHPMPLRAQSAQPLSGDGREAQQAEAAGEYGAIATSSQAVPFADTMLRIGELSAAAPDEENFGRLNLREASIDGLRDDQWRDRDDAPGVRLGTFVLRPTISQSISTESDRYGGSRSNRTYWQTGLGGTLTSDWSRHELSVIGGGEWQKNISGEGETEPEVDIGADLRLDLANETTAHVTGGYRFYREDTDDPNAIFDADTQSGVNQFSGGLTMEHDFGRLRGTAGLALDRTVYSDATLSDGTKLSMQDRDQTAGQLRGRLGYEISPTLMPFFEAYAGRAIYDDEFDALGFARSSRSYGGRGGIEVELGEKLRGELGLGYERVTYQDDRLDPIGAFTIDSRFNWSPRRGTDVALGFATSVNPLTSADESGYVDYTATSLLSHELRHNLVARLSGATTWRRFPSDSIYDDQTIYATTGGLAWGLNRYLDLTGDVGYEYTDNKNSADSQILRAGIGLTLKR
ncbi:outer membrane beta-barrel protein [Rhizobiaceae bacterium n13]|uniref:Outer membrane beta-barrel protein n=1 Tax=Ferirhizobium litorale TaxID=2927786 RepID=A0AAE3Q9A4_9HYPH|nr:outer membrane beta-barrel protein [Fererhizobium litorale]MDI7860515.1 outer membrane beta-barrel protein [Fererhizobium litorale]MDI7920650.1 outer membrane beta-barrel protein [Fererhizobium litorale]